MGRLDAAWALQYDERTVKHVARCGIGWLIVLALAGCAAPGADGRFHDPSAGFSVSLPGSPWQPTSMQGALFSVRQPAWGAGIALASECRAPEPGPLPAVSRHLFFGLKRPEIASRVPVEIAGVPGIRTRLSAQLDERPVEIDAVTLRLEGCLYDLMLVAPPDRFAAAQPDFDRVLASWAVEARR